MATYQTIALLEAALATGIAAPAIFQSIEEAIAEIGARGGGAILYAQRSGSGGKQLVNAATLTAYTDSGSPDYAYNGTGGSDTILVDSFKIDGTPYAAGDQVGIAYAWDEIQQAGTLPVGGSIGTTRDSGYTGIDGITNIDAVRTITGSSGDVTFLVDATIGASGGLELFSPPLSGVAGIRLYLPTTSTARARIYTGTGTSVQAIVNNTYTSARWQFIASYRGSDGTVRLRVYNSSGTLINSSSISGTTSLDMRTNHSITALPGASTVHRITVWDEFLSDAACDDVADGTDLTGRASLGGSDLRVHDWTGLRSGTYLSASPTVLQIESAGTGNITAEY